MLFCFDQTLQCREIVRGIFNVKILAAMFGSYIHLVARNVCKMVDNNNELVNGLHLHSTFI